MRPDWKTVERNIRKDISKAMQVTQEVFTEEVFDLEAGIILNFYSRTTETGLNGLKPRTGNARRGWETVVVKSPGRGMIGRIKNGVPYADQSVTRTIRPTNKKWLAIPSSNAKTRAGVPRYTGPRDPKAPAMFFLKGKKPGTAFLIAKDKSIPKNKRLLFILKKKVVVKAHTKGLFPYARRRTSLIASRVRRALWSL